MLGALKILRLSARAVKDHVQHFIYLDISTS
jgi:hypothetical protein